MPSRQERRKAQRKQNKETQTPDDFLKEYYDYHNVSQKLDPLFHFRPLMRKSIHDITDKIKVNHCVICGDTEKDGKLILADTDRGQDRFCEFCYNAQQNL